MRQILPLLILLASFTAFGQEFEFDYHSNYDKILKQTNDSKNNLHYDKLLKRFQNNDTTLTDFEVLALLIGFTDDEHFKPYSYLSIERDIYSLNGGGKFEEALAKCDSFLMHVPLSQQAIIEKSYACHKLGQADSARHYMTQFGRIMDAMARSGDGLTAETAYFSLGPVDGQNFIQKYTASGIGTMGSGSDKHGNFVDILEATWEDEESGEKKSRMLYFQIQHATSTMFGDLDKKSKKKKKKEKKKKGKREIKISE